MYSWPFIAAADPSQAGLHSLRCIDFNANLYTYTLFNKAKIAQELSKPQNPINLSPSNHQMVQRILKRHSILKPSPRKPIQTTHEDP